MDTGTLYPLIAIGPFVALALVVKFSGYIRAMRLKGKTVDFISNDELRNRLAGERVSVIYFYSPKCRVCTMENPVIGKIKENDIAQVVEVNVLSDKRTAKDFSLAGTPTIAVISHGVVSDVFVGFTPIDVLYTSITKFNKGGDHNV